GRRGRVLSRAEVFLDDLAEALVGEGAVLLDEAAVQDADAPRAREPLDLLEQPALADAGLAADDDELALARDGGVQAVLQLGELTLAPGEGHDLAVVGLEPRDARRRHGDRASAVVRAEPHAVAREHVGDLARGLGPA